MKLKQTVFQISEVIWAFLWTLDLQTMFSQLWLTGEFLLKPQLISLFRYLKTKYLKAVVSQLSVVYLNNLLNEYGPDG